MHQHATLEDTVYFWFASNDTSGSGDDGASAAADVRLAGDTASAAPVLSPTPDLLTHANYPSGCYEVGVDCTAANGFATANTYAVFCTLAVDSQNPTGFIGSVTLDPIVANIKEIDDSSQAAVNQAFFLNTALVGTTQSGSTSTVIKSNLTGYGNDEIIGAVVYFEENSTGWPQRVTVEDYDSTSGDITVSQMAQIPANGDVFSLI